MPRQSALVFQHAFNKGEISSDLFARKDWAPVYHGAASAKNVIVKTTGAAVKAPGTRFIGEALEQDRPIRFIKFQFSDSQSYVLEFGHLRFRIIHDGGFVVYPPGHEQAGEIVILESPFTIDQMQAVNVNVNVGERSCDYAQENDTVIIVHPGIAPKILTRYDHHDWRWDDFGPEADIATPQNLNIAVDGGNNTAYCVSAYRGGDESFPSNTVLSSSDDGDGKTQLEWDPVDGAAGYRVYRQYETEEGYEWRLVASPSTATYTDSEGASGNAGTKPRIESNPFNQPGRYPSLCVFHENRLVMAGPNEKPNRVYGSRLGDFRNFALPRIGEDPTDEDAYEWALTGGSTSPIFTALVSNTELILLATSGEFRADGTRPALAFGSKIQSHYGSAAVLPILYRQAVIFAGKDRRSLNAFTVSPLTGNYDATEISHFSGHIFEETRIRAIAAQSTPYKNIWCVMENGQAAVVTYMQDQEVLGVTRRITEGKFEVVESIDANGETDVYFQTARTVNGVEKRCIEVMARHYQRDTLLEDAWYVDCGLEYRGEPKKTISGLEHLEGKDVVVAAEGRGYGYDGEEITVKNGSITIPFPAGHVIVGLGYEAELKTVDMAPQGYDAASRTRQPVSATVTFLRTRDCMISCEGSAESSIDFFPDYSEYGEPKELTAKTFVIPPDPKGSKSSSLTLRSRSPWPWGISRIDMVVTISSSNNMRD